MNLYYWKVHFGQKMVNGPNNEKKIRFLNTIGNAVQKIKLA